MYNYSRERILLEGEYIVKHSATVRQTAKVFGIGKSTVHKDVTSRLKEINVSLYLKVQEVLQTNLSYRASDRAWKRSMQSKAQPRNHQGKSRRPR